MSNLVLAPTKIIRGPLAFAERCDPVFKKVRTSRLSPAQANGIRYENKVHKALETLARGTSMTYERNPWFRYGDENGRSSCSPDGILWLDQHTALTIEVKYTFPASALDKMKGLYLPVVATALRPKTIRGLIICKTLTPEALKPISCASDALAGPATVVTVLQWLGQGPLRWT